MRTVPSRVLLFCVFVCALIPMNEGHADWPREHADREQTRFESGVSDMAPEGVSLPGVSWRHQLVDVVPDGALMDLDADGEPEFVVCSLGRIWVYDAPSGDLVWSSEDLGVTDVIPSLHDLDGSPGLELLAFSQNPGARLWVLDARSGVVLHTARPLSASLTLGIDEIVVANIDDDPLPEVVWSSAGSKTPDLNITEFNESLGLWQSTAAEGVSQSSATPMLAIDIDADGREEVAAILRDGSLVAYQLEDKDPSQFLSFPEIGNVASGLNNQTQFLNLDGDDELELLLNGTNFGIRGFGAVDFGTDPEDGDSTRLWGCWFGNRNTTVSMQLDTPKNLDSDPNLEVVVGVVRHFSLDTPNTVIREDFGPCPGAEEIEGRLEELNRFHTLVIDTVTGEIDAAFTGLGFALATVDLDDDGIAEVLLSSGLANSGSFYKVDAELGTLERISTLSIFPVASKLRFEDHRSAQFKTAPVVRVVNGTNALLTHTTSGVLAWVGIEDGVLARLEAVSTNCGEVKDVWAEGDALRVLLQDGDRACIFDESFEQIATLQTKSSSEQGTVVGETPGLVTRNHLLSGNLDGVAGPDELRV